MANNYRTDTSTFTEYTQSNAMYITRFGCNAMRPSFDSAPAPTQPQRVLPMQGDVAIDISPLPVLDHGTMTAGPPQREVEFT